MRGMAGTAALGPSRHRIAGDALTPRGRLRWCDPFPLLRRTSVVILFKMVRAAQVEMSPRIWAPPGAAAPWVVLDLARRVQVLRRQLASS